MSDTTNLNLNSSKSAARPSHEALETETGAAPGAEDAADKHLDRVAMESATRSQHRIHADEQKNPEDTIFTK